MNLFFYGTLLDRAVLEEKAGRAVAPSRLVAATLDGYRRFRVRGKPYPMLVPASRGDRIDGILMKDPDRAILAGLRRYEGSLYQFCRVVVSVEGRPVPAMLFNARPIVRSSGEPWMPSSGTSRRSGRYRP